MTGQRVDENKIREMSKEIAQKESPFIVRNIESLSEKERPLEEPQCETSAEKRVHTEESFMQSYNQGLYNVLLDQKDRAQIEEQLKPSRTTLGFFYTLCALIAATSTLSMGTMVQSYRNETLLHERTMRLSKEMENPYLTQEEVRTIEAKLNCIEKQSQKYVKTMYRNLGIFTGSILETVLLTALTMREEEKRKNKRRNLAWEIYQQRNRCNEKG